MKNDNIKWCYHFPLYIFCDIIYVIIFRVLFFMLSFDVIIFHGQQMLSFLCYHFPLYIFYVIIYVIIWCYHLLLSFPPFFLFPENVTHSNLCEILEILLSVVNVARQHPTFLGCRPTSPRVKIKILDQKNRDITQTPGQYWLLTAAWDPGQNLHTKWNQEGNGMWG